MKKHILFAAALAGGFFLAQPEAKAQGAYVKLGGAYNFGVASYYAYKYTSNTTWSPGTNPTNSSTFEKVNVNLGKGITAGATAGYMFNEHLGAELGIGYLIGGKNEIKDTNTHNGKTETDVFETSSRMLLLQPALVISAGMDGINPYARFGVIAAKGTVTDSEIEMQNDDKIEQETEYTGGWGIGLQGGIGAEFKLNENLAFFSELTMSNLSYSPEKSELTKASINGKNVLGELTTEQKEVEYVDEHTYTNNTDHPDSEPRTGQKFNMPFSTVGIGIGIKMNF